MAAAAGAMILGLGAATPASAALTLTDSSCDVFSASGCAFEEPGNGNANDTALGIETAYNAQHVEPPNPATIDLAFLDKIEAGIDFADELSSTSWSSGSPINFLVVKGASNFVLYGFETPISAGTATNFGLLKGNGAPGAAISHISFYNGTFVNVPEPATWALMLGGFFGAGAMLRRGRRTPATA